ncbi:aldehyde dehydrogenase family protein [Nocardia sp. NPDC059246]|uniref:aldehyde dehydrogenase family protein n=1 Tax=unclassified Nocardia TaxID=2637762 RepID=UPI0036AE7CA6
MKAVEAVGWVDAGRWSATPPEERLKLLKEIQANIERYFEELVDADCEAKGIVRGEAANAFHEGTSVQSTIVPVASSVTGAIELYEGLVRGESLEPLGISPVGDDRFDIDVSPRGKDRLLNGDRTDILRVKGQPRRSGPYDKPAGIIAVLGAGNYASAFEVIRALFFDGYAVVHKPHPLNVGADRVWEKVLEPLVAIRALSFCESEDGRALTEDPRLTKIYFTGGTKTAKAIIEATGTELVSEAGGNNPCIVIPGDRPWTEKEIRHQALQIATIAKINGGAICGRVQTLVTSRHWPQRQEFLDAVAHALREGTPAATTYYPGVNETFDRFRAKYPDATLIQPVDEAPASRTLLVEDAGTDEFGIRNEAFCQVISEVALDVEARADVFTPAAVQFCNDRLLGTLAATILVDEDTKKAHASIIDDAVTQMNYGAIGVNTMPPVIWLSPYLTWGGNEEGREFVSGRGNFGNLLGYENVEKSIVISNFTSAAHLIATSKKGWLDLSMRATRYTINPTWSRLAELAGTALVGHFRRVEY